jgi:hypothetical protein
MLSTAISWFSFAHSLPPYEKAAAPAVILPIAPCGVDGPGGSSMSFAELDEAPRYEDEEPSPPEHRERPTRPSGPERRAVLRRRLLSLVFGAVLLFLLVIATRGCLDARQDRAYREYARDVAALSDESLQQSKSLFELLRGGARDETVEVQNTVNGYRTQADQLVERAHALEAPDRMASANRFLAYSLEFRRDGLAGIATELPTALGEEYRDAASARIARQMRNFLVSDALFDQRVAPEVRAGLRERRLGFETGLPAGGFLPGIDWLEEAKVSERLGALREGPGEVAAGARGLALGVVTAGGETLNESAPTQVTAKQDLAFSVQVQNQGAVPEEEVKVSVSLSGGAAPMSVERTLESIPAGGSETATLPLADTPPTDKPVTVTIRVEPAQGEGMTDDNESAFPATFVPG